MAQALSNTRAIFTPSALPKLARILELGRQRRALMRLDAAQLSDIGVTATQARTEARKPVWDVPCHWQR